MWFFFLWVRAKKDKSYCSSCLGIGWLQVLLKFEGRERENVIHYKRDLYLSSVIKVAFGAALRCDIVLHCTAVAFGKTDFNYFLEKLEELEEKSCFFGHDLALCGGG